MKRCQRIAKIKTQTNLFARFSLYILWKQIAFRLNTFIIIYCVLNNINYVALEEFRFRFEEICNLLFCCLIIKKKNIKADSGVLIDRSYSAWILMMNFNILIIFIFKHIIYYVNFLKKCRILLFHIVLKLFAIVNRFYPNYHNRNYS